MDAVINKPFTIAQRAQCLLDQVPQFQTPAGGPETVNEDSPVREFQSGASHAGGSVDLPLVDPTTLDQLRTLNEAKKGDFLERVAKLYSEHAPKACAQLSEHAKAVEAEACDSVAHSLKSISLNIGAVEESKLAAGFAH